MSSQVVLSSYVRYGSVIVFRNTLVNNGYIYLMKQTRNSCIVYGAIILPERQLFI